MTTLLGILLEPLDVLVFRDGRPFDVGMRGSTGLPLPQTTAGVVRTRLWQSLGIDFSRMSSALQSCEGNAIHAAAQLLGEKNAWAADIRMNGPWLYDKAPLVAMPADLVRRGKKSTQGPLVRLRPAPAIPGWKPRRPGMVPLWHNEPDTVERVQGFLSAAGLGSYLQGRVPPSEAVVSSSALLETEDRTGIGINEETGTAEDHRLFSSRFLRLRSGVSFYLEVELPDQAPKDVRSLFECTVPLGGEGRRALMRVTTPWRWPSPAQGSAAGLALLVTPGLFPAPHWAPQPLLESGLVSAAVPGSLPLSGWDFARRCPKPVRHAVPSGAVYYAELSKCQGAGAFLRLCTDVELNAQGYGLALQGVRYHG